MKQKISYLAYKYRNNKLAKIFIRPFWHLRSLYLVCKRKEQYRKMAPEVLKVFKQVLDNDNIFFWLEFGTLLGAYRDNNFIGHDMDIDVGTFYTDREKTQTALTQKGFKLLKEFVSGKDGIDGFEQTYKYLDVTIDVFYFFMEKDGMYCNTFSFFDGDALDPTAKETIMQVKKITVPYNGFEKIKFNNEEYNVPAKTNIHLMAHYGNDFMTPNSLFDYKKDATNVYFYSRKERIATMKIF